MNKKEKRISCLKSYIASLKDQQSKLNAIKEYTKASEDAVIRTNLDRITSETQIIDNLAVVSEEKDLKAIFKSTYSYQIYLLEYGLNRTKSDIAFYEEILKLEMEK